MKDNEVVVVGFFSSTESAEYKAFFGAAELGEESFVYTTDAAIAAHFKATSPAVIVLKKVWHAPRSCSYV